MALLPFLPDIGQIVAERSGLYVFALANSDMNYSIVFPVNPERFDVQLGGRFVAFETLRAGEVVFPRGRRAERVRWTGKIFGIGRWNGLTGPYGINTYSFPPPLIDPYGVINRLGGLLQKSAEKQDSRCLLLITRPYVNMLCYVEDFSYASSGAFGDVDYTVQFVEARDIGESTGTNPSVGFPRGLETSAAQQSNNAAQQHLNFEAAASRSQTENPLNPFLRELTPIQSVTLQEIGGLKPRLGLRRGDRPVVEANADDTWLNIAFKAYGSTEDANVIRTMNYLISNQPTLPLGEAVVAPSRS